MKQNSLLSNAGLVEIEKTIMLLYNKKLLNKDEIKELIASLNRIVSTMPDYEELYLH